MTAAQVATLNSQLIVAREELVKLTAQRDAIVKRDDSRHWTETDSAIGSGVRRKANAKADARRYNGYDRDAQVFADHAEAESLVAVLELRLSAAVKDRDRVRLTRDEIVGATAVRTALYGWRLVRRVNAKTVSIDSGYTWATLVKFDDVLAVRKGTVTK